MVDFVIWSHHLEPDSEHVQRLQRRTLKSNNMVRYIWTRDNRLQKLRKQIGDAQAKYVVYRGIEKRDRILKFIEDHINNPE